MNNTTLRTLSLLSLLSLTACASRPGPTLRERYGLKPPASFDPSRTALVLVDFQEEFFAGGLPVKDAPRAVQNAQRLLGWARATGVRVVHVHNIAPAGSRLFGDGSPGAQVRPEVAPVPGELVIIKHMAGAFSRTELHPELQARGIDTLIVAGLMTHLAVDTTVRDGLVLGYRVVVASDAAATRDLPGAAGAPSVPAKTVHASTLASLADRFADVLPTREIQAIPVTGVTRAGLLD